MAKVPAKSKRLKVYCTSIGFHDAYVAAPSKKAALKSWGSKKDLFARGAAELVTDPALERDALASPGTVIKVSRGSVAEQLAALPKDLVAAERTAKKTAKPGKTPPTPPAPKPEPRPSRDWLESAERAVAALKEKQKKALAVLAEREAKLAEERRRLLQDHFASMQQLVEERDECRRRFDAAMKRWRAMD